MIATHKLLPKRLRGYLHLLLGRLWLHAGRPGRARRELELALHCGGDEFGVRVALGRAALAEGSGEHAAWQMELARRCSPDRFARLERALREASLCFLGEANASEASPCCLGEANASEASPCCLGEANASDRSEAAVPAPLWSSLLPPQAVLPPQAAEAAEADDRGLTGRVRVQPASDNRSFELHWALVRAQAGGEPQAGSSSAPGADCPGRDSGRDLAVGPDAAPGASPQGAASGTDAVEGEGIGEGSPIASEGVVRLWVDFEDPFESPWDESPWDESPWDEESDSADDESLDESLDELEDDDFGDDSDGDDSDGDEADDFDHVWRGRYSGHGADQSQEPFEWASGGGLFEAPVEDPDSPRADEPKTWAELLGLHRVDPDEGDAGEPGGIDAAERFAELRRRREQDEPELIDAFEALEMDGSFSTPQGFEAPEGEGAFEPPLASFYAELFRREAEGLEDFGAIEGPSQDEFSAEDELFAEDVTEFFEFDDPFRDAAENESRDAAAEPTPIRIDEIRTLDWLEFEERLREHDEQERGDAT